MGKSQVVVLALVICGGLAWARPTLQEAKLTATLQQILVTSLPSPLYEDNKHWGKQHKNLRGKMKNDGRWWKVRIEPRQLSTASWVSVDTLRPAGNGKTTFTVRVALPARVVLNRQTWLRGARVFSGETRARVDLYATMDCESELRFETKKGAAVPDLVFSIRVIRSDFKYDGLVVEHTAGVGGDAARTLGDVVLGVIKQVKPSLERRLIGKANAAILKAGNNKQVRLSFSKLAEAAPTLPAVGGK
jgi:hypothetical protein